MAAQRFDTDKISISPPPWRSTDPCRHQAVLQHRYKRFVAADATHNRYTETADASNRRSMEPGSLVEGVERAKLLMRCHEIENRIEVAEDQLSILFGDTTLLMSLRELVRELPESSLACAVAPGLASLKFASSLKARPAVGAGMTLPPRHDGSLITAEIADESAKSCSENDFKSLQEELKACHAFSRQAIDMQESLAEATQTQIFQIKKALTVAEESLEGGLQKMQSLLAESQSSHSPDHLVDLKSDHHLLRKEFDELRDVSHLRTGKSHQGSDLMEISRSLVCLTSDFDMMEARFSEQLSSLQVCHDRHARALQGHLACSHEQAHRVEATIDNLAEVATTREAKAVVEILLDQ